MNEPLINPWIFYFIDMFSNLNAFFLILGFLIAILTIGTFFCSITEVTRYREEYKNLIKWLKRGAMTSFALLFVSIFLPSEKTMYKMIVAHYATKENINAGVDFIVETVDKAVEKIMRRERRKKDE